MVTIVAHRGDSEAARENTPEAFAAAFDAGADVVEVDIRTTRDGTSVLLHDDTLLRLWGREWPVALTTHRPDAGTRGQGTDVSSGPGDLVDLGQGGCRIPTLTATLAQVAELNEQRARPVTLLIDTTGEDDVAVAVDLVRTYLADNPGARLPVRWCGDTAAMFRVRAELPEADVCYNHEGGELDGDVVGRLAPSTINVEWVLVTAELVQQVHGMGLALACWTVNDAETMAWLVERGVDAITTDRPRLLRRVLSRPVSPLSLAWADVDPVPARTGWSREQAQAVRVARDLAHWANAFTRTAALGRVATKAHAADPVTAVDLAVERHVREVIAERLGPDHVVVGEEMGGRAEAGRPVWYLDPVDGTTNLANGLPWTSMSLAMAVDGEPLVAAVAQPALGHVFLAVRGLGATLDGVPLQVGRCDDLAGRTVLTELDAHAMWPGMDAFLTALAERHCTPRVMGSGTLALTGVAAGWAAAGVVHRFNPIDHLAGSLVAHEAGATVTGLDGTPTLFPTAGGVAVCAPGAGPLVLAALR